MKNRKRRTRASRLNKEEKSWLTRIVSSIFSFIMVLMGCVAVVLTGQIYEAGGFDPVIEKWDEISSSISLTHLKEWLFLEKWISNQVLQVSSHSYQWVEDQVYEVSNHEVIAIDDGIVIYCGKQNEKAMVMVRQDNGLIVTYGQLNEVFCSEDDRLVAGAVLAKVEDQVYLDFSWQGESISYEEALAFKN